MKYRDKIDVLFYASALLIFVGLSAVDRQGWTMRDIMGIMFAIASAMLCGACIGHALTEQEIVNEGINEN